jgi:hypothetical protein
MSEITGQTTNMPFIFIQFFYSFWQFFGNILAKAAPENQQMAGCMSSNVRFNSLCFFHSNFSAAFGPTIFDVNFRPIFPSPVLHSFPNGHIFGFFLFQCFHFK